MPIAPYGSWKSPITSDLIVSKSIGLSAITLDGDDVYWIEGRPSEGGRNVIVKRSSDGTTRDVTPPGFNARTRVHEYGGGSYTVHDGTVYFSNFGDNMLYRQMEGADPQPVTTNSNLRYADFVVDAHRNRLVSVREDHTAQGQEATNTLVAVPLDGTGQDIILVSGNNFYSTPRLSPDGSRLVYLTWNHPNMPWDGTELWVADVAEDGTLSNSQLVAGGPAESIFGPEWSPDGELYFVADTTGWWNLYHLRDNGSPEPLHAMEAEFGRPQWVFSLNTYTFESPGRIVCIYAQNGTSHLATLDTQALDFNTLNLPFTEFWGPKAAPGSVYVLVASPTEAWSIVRIDLSTLQIETLRRSEEHDIDSGYLSTPQPIEFPTENGLTAHAFFYPPTNKDYTAPAGEKPPLIVISHGGPTSATGSDLDLEIQFWTSHGFAVTDVNYGGSTGYGRPYRQRLNGQWGVVDVDDCVNAARYLADRGLVDPDRLTIRGGSAGGYTTLLALTQKDAFKAGASYFGISELEVFATDTHKFESRYLDSLVGPYPEAAEVYRQRSALNYLEGLSCPVIFFQGLDDKVVPPNQARLMVDALRAREMPVAHVEFEGEGHGFRRAENIKRSLENEFYFYSRIFGFNPADSAEPIEIENL